MAMQQSVGKNDIVELEIGGVSHDGRGIGRAGELAVFVPYTAPGDRVRAEIVRVRRDMAYARLLEVLAPSTERVEPDCPAFGKCGGCAFRHIRYEEELRIKARRVEDALTKIGHIQVTPEPIVPCGKVRGYRNKAQYPVGRKNGRMLAGFFAPGSHRIVANRACLLQPACFQGALRAFEDWVAAAGVTVYDEKEGRGLLRHIYLRQANATGELMACAVINGNDIPQKEKLIAGLSRYAPELKSLMVNINRGRTNVILGGQCFSVWGSETISDVFCGLKIEISPLSFYQVNTPQAEKLYQAAAEYAGLRGGELLVDLYCGMGTIGLSMAGDAGRVIGVEIVRQAVEDARRNAALNGIRNAEFLHADAEQAAKELAGQGLRPDVVTLDPPRKGCSRETISSVLAMRPGKIVYVSCDPATLARDLAMLEQGGYRCTRARPFDLFPRTAHVECVALMSRAKE